MGQLEEPQDCKGSQGCSSQKSVGTAGNGYCEGGRQRVR